MNLGTWECQPSTTFFVEYDLFTTCWGVCKYQYINCVTNNAFHFPVADDFFQGLLLYMASSPL